MTTVVLLGLPKSGTTALYFAVKDVMQPELSMHEPGTLRQVEYFLASEAPSKLTKILYPKLSKFEKPVDLSVADKIVLITRDPRDVLVSWLLYRPLLHGNFKDRRFLDDFVAALRAKEADPPSVSVRELYGVLDRHDLPYTRMREYSDHYRMGLRLMSEYPDMYVQRFEDFVDGDVRGLSEYLGFVVPTQTEVSAHLGHNTRAKAAGGWRDWYTADDVERYRRHFDKWIERYGYDEDWTLSESPRIDPATSSEYVLRNVERLTKNPRRYGHLREKEHYDRQAVSLIESAADDGSEAAMIELALLKMKGIGVKRDTAAAIRLLEDTVARGNTLGMIHLSLAYELGKGVPADAARVQDLRAAAGAVIGNDLAKKRVATLRPLWSGQEPTLARRSLRALRRATSRKQTGKQSSATG